MKIDIFRQKQGGVFPSGKAGKFEYFCSTIRHKTCNEAIKALSPSIQYAYTKNRKDYFHDSMYRYVAYKAVTK